VPAGVVLFVWVYAVDQDTDYWVPGLGIQDVFNRFGKLQWVDRDGNIDEEIEKGASEAFKLKVEEQIAAKLPHSPYCLNRTGKVVGSLDDLEWMFLLNCVADYHESNVVYSWDKKGWIGFSHRGRQLFRVGDRIFEEDYVPKKKDYSNEQWMAFIEARNYSYTKYCEEHPGMEKQEYNKFHPLVDFIPFVLRGARTITSDPRARRAAINFSRYVA
jgi:hypothetical protein